MVSARVIVRLKGGAGSGHHGHSGRVGKVGGSISGDISSHGVTIRGGSVKERTVVEGALARVTDKLWKHSKLNAVIISSQPRKDDPGTLGTYERGIMTLHPNWDKRGAQVPLHEFAHSIRHAAYNPFTRYCKKNNIRRGITRPGVRGRYEIEEFFADTFTNYTRGFKGGASKFFIARYGSPNITTKEIMQD